MGDPSPSGPNNNGEVPKAKPTKGPTNGAGGPQHFYSTGYPPHYHHVPQHHMQHSPPPAVYQKDERTQQRYTKLKQKLDRKQANRNNGIEVNSGASTPSLSPRKEMNGRGGGSGGASSGAWSEGEGSSAGASVQGDDETDVQAILDLLSATRTPQVSDITPTSALVQWNSPHPEGVALPSLELTYDLLLGDRDVKRYKAIYSGPSLSCRVRDLRPGCEYSVCLQIRAGALTGAASDAATFRAPPAPPDRMAPLRVTQRARSSLQLRWNAANDNGARIQNYIVEMDSGDGFQELVKPRTKQHTANNLRPQTRYRFRIAAVNEVGRSEWSDETVEWTAGSPPPAPPPPSLRTASATALALAWERRSDEEFVLQMDDVTRGHGFLPVYSGPEKSYVCAGLRRATEYKFRLRCETSDGQGPWSPEVAYRTLPERPGAPGRPLPRGKIHSRAFRLRWDPPPDDGGAAVASYTLELDGGDGYRPAYQGPEREAHCERLQPGTAYRARVRCENVAGVGEWSACESVPTERAPPAACAGLVPAAPPRATLLALRWGPPDQDGGEPLTEYRVDLQEADDGATRVAHTGTAPECIIRDLTPGRRYRVWVTACNRVGPGPASSALEFTTAAAPPDAPPAPTATIETPRSARLEWTSPADNGAPIVDYRLEMSVSNVDDAFAEVYRGVSTACVVTKLTPFSPYFFRVCATNSAGRGAWSLVRDLFTPRAPPAAPTGLRHEATADSLRLYWRTPADHGAEIIKYRVEVDSSSFETEGPTPERIVEELTPDTVYRVRVAALNEIGLGDWSEEARASTRPTPPSPPELRLALAAHNYLKLEWSSSSEGAQYCVEMRGPDGREFRHVYRGSARSCKVKKLHEATTYTFRIQASDERGGRGSWSPGVSYSTPPAPPPAPRPPALQPAPRAALVAWDALDRADYVLQCARAKDPVFKQVYAGSENQFQLEDLEAGAEYLLRVMAVRDGLASAWSGTARLVVPAGVPAARARRARAAGTSARALTPRQAALLMAAGFLLLAVLVAVLVQRLVEPRP